MDPVSLMIGAGIVGVYLAATAKKKQDGILPMFEDDDNPMIEMPPMVIEQSKTAPTMGVMTGPPVSSTSADGKGTVAVGDAMTGPVVKEEVGGADSSVSPGAPQPGPVLPTASLAEGAKVNPVTPSGLPVLSPVITVAQWGLTTSRDRADVVKMLGPHTGEVW